MTKPLPYFFNDAPIETRDQGLVLWQDSPVVRRAIDNISSELGIGTKMTITLPITLAIIGVLMVDLAGRTFAVPLANVEEAIVLDERDVRSIDGREVLNQRGRTLPLCRLA